MNKLYILDANSIFYRSFYALPHFHTSKGVLTNAVYGFTATLLSFLLDHEPTHIAVVFDKGKKTFRHVEYKEYKATRPPAPDELYAQIPMTKEIVSAFGLPLFEEDNYEADDIIGAIAKRAEKIPDTKIFITTSDRDALQLVSDKTSIIIPKKGFNEFEVITPQNIKERFEMEASQVPDYKALAGDNSDNIKGVPGIGEKTAKNLLTEYGTLDKIYENLDKLPAGIKLKLETGKVSAYFSKRMATLVTDFDPNFSLEKSEVRNFSSQKIKEIFANLEFKSLLKRFENFEQKSQPTLF
ncbi:MAG: polymerase I, DNA polymerase I protein [Candidatus Peregrinibacteria bacterium GW2011_GWC2_39_14]|nr:MAG: polymerase I protein [Candidatus Peregrinibacteria bacterium GW2011_GWA2_38_36]KKR07171.1 MAG: polymerase I, DNA polymerase I protein [Candidatus Peregrinibacteria bacterium GW2011_GWC2_39_14]